MTKTNTTHENTDIGIDIEATEMAMQMINGNRNDVREFLAGHDQPATLALKIVRNLWTMSELEDNGQAMVEAVLDVQALLSVQSEV